MKSQWGRNIEKERVVQDEAGEIGRRQITLGHVGHVKNRDYIQRVMESH